MRSVNRIVLIGHTGNDPEIRMTSGGTKVAKLSLATSDKRGGTERTEWHRITCFGKMADIVEQYIRKGDPLYIEGKVEYSRTDDGEGHTRYWTDIIAKELVMLGIGGRSDIDTDEAVDAIPSPFED